MSLALSSWKEIAAYMGKGVRTVQRWEQQFGLPIRRPNSKSHVIFAIPQELDAWMRRQQKTNHLPTNHLPADARQTRREELQKQRELLSRLKSAYLRLEATERVLGKNLDLLLEGFCANSVPLRPKQSNQNRREGQNNPKFQKVLQSKGAA